MKKATSFVALLFMLSASFYAGAQNQPKNGYTFTVVKELPVTSIKNQNRTSTCWSFSTLSYLESELIRKGKGEHDLSEMFVVSSSYYDKADKYIRTGGKINMAPGSSFGDALYVWKNYGAVPESAMSGLNYGEEMHVHNELDAVLEGYVKALEKNPNGKLSTAWKRGIQGILDAYLGEKPEKFTYMGREFTPMSFAEYLDIKTEDYISITSYNHHPFYTTFALEIPDNWRWDSSWNIPMDELIQVIDHSVEKGYTVLWASDVSEKGFTRRGVAFIPETEAKNMSGSDQAKWLGVPKNEIDNKIYSLEEIVPEKSISQEMRQISYDNGQTTDDHGMHIFGIAKDQAGNKYYMVKNSWGLSGDYKGVWYVSESFVKYKTMNIVVNKESAPKEILKKLNLK